MADASLKPLIRAMVAMALVAGAVLFGYSVRLAILEEQQRIEANMQANKERQEQWRKEREAADLRAKARREDDALRLAQGQARDHATLQAIQAKKRAVDVGSAFGNVRRRAEDGEPNAQHLLGRIYLRGMDDVLSVDPATFGVSYSAPAAAALTGEPNFSRSAEVIRFVNLPRIPANPKEAARWFERAALQGHREAQSSLAQLYCYQLADPVAGYRWVLISEGPAVLPDELKVESHTPAWRMQLREKLSAKLSPPQRAEAEQLAKEFKPKKEIR